MQLKNLLLYNTYTRRVFYVVFFCLGFLFFTSPTQSASVEELQKIIDSKSVDIANLEKEIAQYQQVLTQTSNEIGTLKGAITNLDTSKKKLETTLQLTQKNIDRTSVKIEQTKEDIKDTLSDIDLHKQYIQSVLQTVDRFDTITPVLHLLKQETYSDALSYINDISSVSFSIKEKVDSLDNLHISLEAKKKNTEAEKDNLSKLKIKLATEKQAVLDAQKEKDKLLATTKNKESGYKILLAEKKKQKEQFEKELYTFESQLKIAIDFSKIPTARSGVFIWPVDKVRITQLFGKTSVSGRLYQTGTHNGIDVGVPDGTPIKAALSGIVKGTGNTDAVNGCYSYGKWAVIEHANGLSTLYGHMSSISAQEGDRVQTGDTIGYSGHSGYATGPHLHLTVVATEGLKLITNPSSIHCKNVIIPTADTKAYLDPMLYLPVIPK